ncbi:hypothetical protein CPSG_06497 [Coccidioides posadasii str. Silveira]|uniref:Uncharacterized protein n=1 Tax=Coccidioides posadasii (strain RMSCC 757 / Silveira) TaxID=443226 RepID=E9D9J5_COCPS|nr:hypothetical protein CPSG_06497 [Coccidioides posadasii str. Silveira]
MSSATITIQTSQVSLTKNLQEIKVRRDSQASDHKQGYPGNLDLTWVIKSGYRLTHNADLARVQALCSASIQGQKRGGQSSVDVSLPRRLRGGTTRPLSAGSCPTVSNLWRRSGGNKILYVLYVLYVVNKELLRNVYFSQADARLFFTPGTEKKNFR